MVLSSFVNTSPERQFHYRYVNIDIYISRLPRDSHSFQASEVDNISFRPPGNDARTYSITTLSIMTLRITIKQCNKNMKEPEHNDTQHNDTQHNDT
jgi:hypothetical protein